MSTCGEHTLALATPVDDEIREVEARLRRLADELVERSRRPGDDALELLAKGTALQRAAFLLGSGFPPDEIDLRGDG
jgi:hypothetical protein